jgi:hypothetical protein
LPDRIGLHQGWSRHNLSWSRSREQVRFAARHGVSPDGRASKRNESPFIRLYRLPAFEQICIAAGGYGKRVEDPAALPDALGRATAVVTARKASGASQCDLQCRVSLSLCGPARGQSARGTGPGLYKRPAQALVPIRALNQHVLKAVSRRSP